LQLLKFIFKNNQNEHFSYLQKLFFFNKFFLEIFELKTFFVRPKKQREKIYNQKKTGYFSQKITQH